MDAAQEKASSALTSCALGNVFVINGPEAEYEPASGSYSSPAKKNAGLS